jgi:hypothetical protein
MPLISIITPSYNQAEFLELTIRSVIEQDFSDLEYIIVDGASTDDSVQIIERYADRLAWWVSEPDSGQAEAINKGLSRARGEFVAWLNSDDLYLPGAVSAAAAALGSNSELGMVFGDAITIDTQGRPLNRLVFGDWGLPELMGFRIICQPTVFMRRSVLERAGCLDSNYHYMLDHHLWLRIARMAPIKHVSQYWAAARHHPEAKNVAQAPAFGQESLRVLEWIQNQPDLAHLYEEQEKQVLAGAYRLNARYLLDGEQPGPALHSYGKSLLARPGFAMQHGHRMLYALLSLIGAGELTNNIYRKSTDQRKRLTAQADMNKFRGWPGLDLTEES